MVRTLIYVMLIYVPPTIIFFNRLARQLMAIRALWGALVISLNSHFTFFCEGKRRGDRGKESKRETCDFFRGFFNSGKDGKSSIMWILRFVRLSPKGRSFYQRKAVPLETSAF